MVGDEGLEGTEVHQGVEAEFARLEALGPFGVDRDLAVFRDRVDVGFRPFGEEAGEAGMGEMILESNRGEVFGFQCGDGVFEFGGDGPEGVTGELFQGHTGCERDRRVVGDAGDRLGERVGPVFGGGFRGNREDINAGECTDLRAGADAGADEVGLALAGFAESEEFALGG